MTDALSRTMTYEYDDNNRRVKTVYADNSFDTMAYDALGRTVAKTDQAGKTTQFFYDALQSKQTPFGVLSYTYDNGGNLFTVRSSHANGVSLDYSYDELNRLSTVQDNRLAALSGGVTLYDYDGSATWRVTSIRTVSGTVIATTR